ncbi:MAG: hypothetical protein KGJ59_06535 [Bacteroidota bacterium]|nr:hypothetical protein [Bacteroidota bacterium]
MKLTIGLPIKMPPYGIPLFRRFYGCGTFGNGVLLTFLIFCVAGTFFAQAQQLPLRQQITRGMNNTVTTSNFFEGQQNASAKKSAATAALYSLLVPGVGEWYAGGFESGRYFLGAEAGLWLTYASFETYGTWLQRDARSFAVAHSGATASGKDDQFYVNLANFMNVYEYNDKKLRDRELGKVYDPDAGYYWQWDSDTNRQQFRAARVSSDRVLNNSRFVIGAIIVNHIVSAINAARIVRNYNKNLSENGFQWGFESSLLGENGVPDGILFTVRGVF